MTEAVVHNLCHSPLLILLVSGKRDQEALQFPSIASALFYHVPLINSSHTRDENRKTGLRLKPSLWRLCYPDRFR